MRGARRGSSLLEFTLIGIPVLFLGLSVFEISMTMWQYHTLEEAVQVGARYAVTHGSSCNCSVTVANIATVVQNAAGALTPSAMNLTLKSSGGTTISCTVAVCISGANAGTTFPPVADSTPGSNITVAVTSTITNPIMMFWPGQATVLGSAVTLGAQSVQEILY